MISLARLRLIGAVFLAASVAAVFFTNEIAAMLAAGVAGGFGIGLLVDTPRVHAIWQPIFWQLARFGQCLRDRWTTPR